MIQSKQRPKKFVPEVLTHLYHTTCYEQLSEQQRLKYNHLFGLRINEQFVMFEEVFIRGLMPKLKRHHSLRTNPKILHDIESILKDEEQHSLMFARFNRRVRPDLYAQNRELFTRLSYVENTLLRMFMSIPGFLPALLWLMLAMEEMTTAISIEIINHSKTEGLDEDFKAIHKFHLEDEKRHVGIDVNIVRRFQECISGPLGSINAMLFQNVFRTVLQPRRSTVQVIRHLAHENPELQKMVPTMIDEVTTLTPRVAFPANLVVPEKMPVLFGLFKIYPDYLFRTEMVN